MDSRYTFSFGRSVLDLAQEERADAAEPVAPWPSVVLGYPESSSPK
jgi:hypothetical protein